MAKTPEDYPTVQVNGGVDGGKCVKLETKDTGSFGSMVKMYIAAGNLFVGSFEVGQALNNAMKAPTLVSHSSTIHSSWKDGTNIKPVPTSHQREKS